MKVVMLGLVLVASTALAQASWPYGASDQVRSEVCGATGSQGAGVPLCCVNSSTPLVVPSVRATRGAFTHVDAGIVEARLGFREMETTPAIANYIAKCQSGYYCLYNPDGWGLASAGGASFCIYAGGVVQMCYAAGGVTMGATVPLNLTNDLRAVNDNVTDLGGANKFRSGYINKLISTSTDQSADCDNAATGNAAVGKVCIQAGQGSMVLTNSLVLTTSIVQLTNISDDTTCLSAYATVAAGSMTVGCVGAATATANTVIAFRVDN